MRNLSTFRTVRPAALNATGVWACLLSVHHASQLENCINRAATNVTTNVQKEDMWLEHYETPRKTNRIKTRTRYTMDKVRRGDNYELFVSAQILEMLRIFTNMLQSYHRRNGNGGTLLIQQSKMSTWSLRKKT